MRSQRCTETFPAWYSNSTYEVKLRRLRDGRLAPTGPSCRAQWRPSGVSNPEDPTALTENQKKTEKFVNSPWYQVFMVALILFQMYMAYHEHMDNAISRETGKRPVTRTTKDFMLSYFLRIVIMVRDSH